MKKITLFISMLTILGLFSIKGQDNNSNNTEILTLCDSIASFNKLSINAICRDGSVNKQFEYFNELLGLTNCNELIELINFYDNKIVKCYAFWGLSKHGCENIFEILIDNLLDNRNFKLSDSGFEQVTTVGDFFINVMTENKVEIGIKKFSKNEKITLDSVLIYNDRIRLNAKNELLRNYKPKEYQYWKIRELTESKYYPFAIVALAKFKKEEDTEFVLDLLKDESTEYYGMLAVREFNSPQFYDILIEKHCKILKSKKMNYPKIRILYQALAQFPTEQTLSQMELGLKKTRGIAKKTHGKYIWLAIDKYPNKIFNDLKSKIKIDEIDEMDFETERAF